MYHAHSFVVHFFAMLVLATPASYQGTDLHYLHALPSPDSPTFHCTNTGVGWINARTMLVSGLLCL